jgi:amidohydrolase
MIREGVLDHPKPDAIFGLHVVPMPSGLIGYRPAGLMAGVDNFRILVRGRGAHGGMPWFGVDPVPVAAQIVLGLQSIVSRQIDLTTAPAVLTVGVIRGGTQFNIVPDEVEISGTIRSLDPGMRVDIQKRIRNTATTMAQASGASAEVTIFGGGAPITYNDPALTARLVPALERAAGKASVLLVPPVTAGEDFAFYQQKVPGLFFFLGIAPRNADRSKLAINHSPSFYVDESALITGVRALAHTATAYLEERSGETTP